MPELEMCPQGRTNYVECFAPFRYCPIKGCGRAEGDKRLPTEATPSDFEAGRRAATADIVAALRRRIEHHDPNASIAAVIWRDAAHLAQRVGDGQRD